MKNYIGDRIAANYFRGIEAVEDIYSLMRLV